MSSMFDDITIEPHRLEWDPDDGRSVEQGGSLLGEGTFGSVYRGEMEGICVAIKVMKAPPGNATGQRASAGRKAAHDQHVREIRRLTKLRFKHVVPCYGVSPAPNSADDLLIITECLDGGSLHGSLEKARAADAVLADVSLLRICTHIAKGLLYIHNSKYIHGDMKPHNVLLNVSVEIDGSVAYFPSHVEAKVADFGMSKRLKADDSFTLGMSTADFGNHPFGTYAYMAPESFNGVRDLDDDALKAVDVFAFGVLFYEMLTGMSPWKFEGIQSPMQLQQLVVFKGDRPSWGTRNIDPEMKKLVERCWHQDARARPTSKVLSVTFVKLLKEATLRDPNSSRSSESSGSVGGASFSSLSSAAVGGYRVRASRQSQAPELPPSPKDDTDGRVSRPQSEESELYHSIPSSPAVPVLELKASEDVRRVISPGLDSGVEQREDRPDRKSRDDTLDVDAPSAQSTAEKRNYWENRGTGSVRNTIAVQPAGSGGGIGESTANPVAARVSEATAGTTSSSVSSSGFGHTMGGIEIRRVETQIISQPDQPQLDLPGMDLPMGNPTPPAADVFNGVPNSEQADKTGTAANALWGNSMIDAVKATNEASHGRRPAVVAPADEQQQAGFGLDLELPTQPRSDPSPADANVAAMAGMTLELPSGGPGHRRAGANSAGGVDVSTDASLSLLQRQGSANTSGGANIYGNAGSRANGSLQSSAQPPHVSGYPGPPRQPNVMTSSSRPDQQTQPQLTAATILQALKSPNGTSQIMSWWEAGNTMAIASALAREEIRSNSSGNQQQVGSERVRLIVRLLKKVNQAQVALKTATNANVARELCISLGNVSRGGTVIDPVAAELALPMTLSTLQAFTWDMNVYSTACYALANMLKVSNEISVDRVRRDVADWISHATSFNLNNQTGPQPTLAYTTAAAARNFTWRKASNAEAFLARREGTNPKGKAIIHPSAAENLCKSMVFFKTDPTVVEVCLSAFAALAFFPQHRINLLKIGTVRAVARVMDRAVTTQNSPLLAMGLATLGTIASRQAASTAESNHIVDALTTEGGLVTVVKALNSAVRARNPRLMEEGLCALAAFARFDQRLGRAVVQDGGVSPVIQAVFCSVEGAPNNITKRSAEVMCDVVDILSQHAAAASAMRQTGLAKPLETLVAKYSSEPRVANPGHQAISRVR